MTNFVWPRTVLLAEDGDRERVEADPAKGIVIRFFGAYSETAPDDLAALLTDDYQDFGHRPPGRGVAGAREDYDVFTAHFSDLFYLLHDLIREGDRVAVRWTATMTHSGAGFLKLPATGRRVTLDGVSIYRIVDGRIAATWNLQDVAALRQQIECP